MLISKKTFRKIHIKGSVTKVVTTLTTLLLLGCVLLRRLLTIHNQHNPTEPGKRNSELRSREFNIVIWKLEKQAGNGIFMLGLRNYTFTVCINQALFLHLTIWISKFFCFNYEKVTESNE